MTTQGQGHSLIFVQGHSDSTFSNFVSSKNSRLFEATLHMDPPWDVGMKICSNVLGHVTKMVSRPIHGKNKEVDNLETWYTALGTQELPNLFK